MISTTISRATVIGSGYMGDVPLNEEERLRIIKKGIEAVLQPSKIRPESHAFLHRIITDAKMHFYDRGDYQTLQLKLYGELYQFLTVEILAHLPAKHRDTFMQMHNQHKPHVEVDKFLEEHMPNAKEVFADAHKKFREPYVGKDG